MRCALPAWGRRRLPQVGGRHSPGQQRRVWRTARLVARGLQTVETAPASVSQSVLQDRGLLFVGVEDPVKIVGGILDVCLLKSFNEVSNVLAERLGIFPG